MNLNNKKASEKILSIYWFVILTIVAGGIVGMVMLFYGAPYDVRDIESNIMVDKTIDCLSENGKLNSVIFLEKGFNENLSLIDECNFNFKTEKTFKNEGQYFLEVIFYVLGSEKSLLTLSEGNFNLASECEIKSKEDERYKSRAYCLNREFYSSDSSGKVYRINILSVIRKTEKNVK